VTGSKVGDTPTPVATKPRLRLLTVESERWLSPNMKRIELVGDELADFPDDRLGGYFKLLLPRRDDVVFTDVASIKQSDYLKRSYTIRAFDRDRRRLTMDAVACAGKGPATAWARDAKAGDRVLTTGPGAVKAVDSDADWVLFAGDMTALPAIATNVERLPPSARGYAVIELIAAEDKPDLAFPDGVAVTWLTNPADSPTSPLAEAVKALPWLEGRPSVWSASEFGSMRELKAYFRERGVTADQLYLSSYWKRGSTDEQHKQAKRDAASAGP